MEVKFKEMSLDEFFNDLIEFFNDERDCEEECNRDCTDDKHDYKYKWPEEKKDESGTIKHLRDVIKVKDKQIKELEEKNAAIVKQGKAVSDSGHKIMDKCNAYDTIIGDKIMADGYKIVNDMKVWAEFVRKCGRVESPAFKTMLDMLNKTLSCVNDLKK